MASIFFKIDGRSIIPWQWGDYGHILQNGIAADLSSVVRQK
jgi:hypothetical protein